MFTITRSPSTEGEVPLRLPGNRASNSFIRSLRRTGLPRFLFRHRRMQLQLSAYRCSPSRVGVAWGIRPGPELYLQSSFPVAASRQRTQTPSLVRAMVWRRPTAIATLEWPWPGFTCHCSQEPSASASWSQSVSVEMPSRFGLRHWGQPASRPPFPPGHAGQVRRNSRSKTAGINERIDGREQKRDALTSLLYSTIRRKSNDETFRMEGNTFDIFH
jgi:hypothetical protein